MTGALHTPERLQIVRETWSAPVPISEILRRLNATPGCHVTGALAGGWAAQLGLKRNHDILIAQQSARAKAMRPLLPGSPPPDDREPALRRIAFGEWTYERLARLCALWDAGGTIAEIASTMGVTKNAISGKIHRLGKRNLVHGRLSPIRPTERAEPAVTRSMGVPAPVVTLPALPSVTRGALPLVFNYPRHSRPPEPRPAPPTQWVADDGSWPTGPARHPCQFVTREGSVVVPWVHCGLPVARGAWCSAHLKVVWHRVRAA